ncbi:MAG: chorismate-binding protein, partial [Planctomycetota bacterium]
MSRSAQITTRELGPGPAPHHVLRAAARRSGAFLLESALRPGRRARWSYVGCEPFSVLSARGRRTWECRAGDLRRRRRTAFNALKESLRQCRSVRPEPGEAGSPELTVGAVGFLGYELGRLVERLPAKVLDELALPHMHLGLYDRTLAYDHEREVWHASAVDFLDGDVSRKMGYLAELLADARVESGGASDGGACAGAADTLRSNFTAEEYEAAVGRVIEYIRAGDIFQANFTQRFCADWPSGGVDLYERLREVNPAPFAAYYDFRGTGGEGTAGGEVISASP